MENYLQERNTKYLRKLREELLPLLPSFCKEFFVGIGMHTTVLTRYNYGVDLKVFFEFSTLYGAIFEGKSPAELSLSDLDCIKKQDIEQFLDYLDGYFSENKQKYLFNKDKAKARKLCAVRALFKYLYNSEKISENVTVRVSMPKIREKEIVRLEDSEVSEVFDRLESENAFFSEHMNTYNNNNTKIRDNVIISLLLNTGIRVSELVGLNLTDIDFSNSSFTVTRKGEKKSILYLSNELNEMLRTYLLFRESQLIKYKLKNENALFLSLQGKRISVRSVEILVKKYASLVTPLKNITPHKLRSTYGTALYRATNDIYVVAEVLGHKDINTTKKHYAAISEDIKKSAVDKVNFKKNTDSDE